MTGARVGNWYLESEIGRGALGVVYRARDYDDPDRRAAVKVFTATAAQDSAFVQKFTAEMLPLQRLDHVNVVKYLRQRHARRAGVRRIRTGGRRGLREAPRSGPAAVARGVVDRGAGRASTQARPQPQRPAPRPETRTPHARGRRDAEGTLASGWRRSLPPLRPAQPPRSVPPRTSPPKPPAESLSRGAATSIPSAACSILS